MQDKICLITGATSGIGEITATELARMGATIVIVARNKEKANQTKQKIISQTGNEKIDILPGDLSEKYQIRSIASEFNEKYPRLDVLINNAGLITGNTRTETSEGHEMTLAVNYLAPFLLTSLLFDKIKQSPQARIINVSSIVYLTGFANFNDIEMHKAFLGLRAYSNSKLYVLLFTQELARRLRPYPTITVNALHPGIIKSNFSKNTGGLTGMFFKLTEPLLNSPEKGAQTSIYLASAEGLEKYNGLFFVNKKPSRLMNLALTVENAQRLWDISQTLTHSVFL